VGARPSWKKIHRVCREISDRTMRATLQLAVADQVARRNRTLRGWWNYLSHGTVGRADQVVNRHAEERLRRWLCAKHKEPRPGYTRYPSRHLDQDLGLVKLRKLRPETSSGAKGVTSPVRELDAGDPPVQVDERGVETGQGRDGGTPADERAGQQGKTNFDLNDRATPRLYALFCGACPASPARRPRPTGPPDGVSRSAPPTPAAPLVALAAAGRNPADLTLPTAGSQAVDPPGEEKGIVIEDVRVVRYRADSGAAPGPG
jgi:Group II intron, maturase-specific domain